MRLLFILLVLLPAHCVDVMAQEEIKSSDLRLKEVVLHSVGKGWFLYEANVQGQADFDIRVRESEISEIVRHTVVTDPEGHGRVTVPSRRDPWQPEMILPRTETLADLLLSMRGQPVEIVTHEGDEWDGRLAALELRSKIVEEQRIDYEVLTVLSDQGLISVLLEDVAAIRTDDDAFNKKLHLALDGLIADEGIATTTVNVRFDDGKPRTVQVRMLREMPIWKLSYIMGPETLLLRFAIDNTTEEDWDDVRVILQTGTPMTFQMDVASIVRADRIIAQRPVPTMQIAPTLAESSRWLQSEIEPKVVTKPRRGENPFGVDVAKDDPFGSDEGFGMEMGGGGMGGGGMFGGGMGGMMGSSASTPKRSRSRVNEIKDSGGDLESQDDASSAGAGLTAKFESVDLPKGQLTFLDSNVTDLDYELVSVYLPNRGSSKPMAALRLTPKVPFVLPAGPLTVLAPDGAYHGEAVMPSLTPGVNRLIPFAIDEALRIKQLPVKSIAELERVTVISEEHRIETSTATTSTISYRIDNRDQRDRIVLIEHPRPDDSIEILNLDFDAEPTARAIRFTNTVPAGETVQRDVVHRSTATLTIDFERVSQEQLRTWIASSKADAKVQEKLKVVSEQRVQLTQLKKLVSDLVQQRIKLSEEIVRVTGQLTPPIEKSVPLPDKLRSLYEERLFALETERDQLIKNEEDLLDKVDGIEQGLGIETSNDRN